MIFVLNLLHFLSITKHVGVWRALLAAKCGSGQRSWLTPLSSGRTFSCRVHGETSQRLQHFYQALTFLGNQKSWQSHREWKFTTASDASYLFPCPTVIFSGKCWVSSDRVPYPATGGFPCSGSCFHFPRFEQLEQAQGMADVLHPWVVSHCQHCPLQGCSSGILACHGLGCCRTVRMFKALLLPRACGWALSWLDSELGTKQHKGLGSGSVMINWNIPASANQGCNWMQVTTTSLSLSRDVLQQTLLWVHWPAGACELRGQPRLWYSVQLTLCWKSHRQWYVNNFLFIFNLLHQALSCQVMTTVTFPELIEDYVREKSEKQF